VKDTFTKKRTVTKHKSLNLSLAVREEPLWNQRRNTPRRSTASIVEIKSDNQMGRRPWLTQPPACSQAPQLQCATRGHLNLRTIVTPPFWSQENRCSTLLIAIRTGVRTLLSELSETMVHEHLSG
jgi:hypothetical protein